MGLEFPNFEDAMKRVLTILALCFPSWAMAEQVPVPDDVVEEYLNLGRDAHKSRDFDVALRWYRVAEDLGSDAAHANIGLLFMKGYGVDLDWRRGVSMMRAAAKGGNPRVMYVLGNELALNAMVRRSMKETLRAPTAHASQRVGPVEDPSAEALLWLERSAKSGFVPAMSKLAGWGDRQNPTVEDRQVRKQAVDMLSDEAAQENTKAQLALASLLQHGSYVSKDLARAEALYRSAAAAGGDDERIRLGRFLGFNGDPVEAEGLLLPLAEEGSVEAMRTLYDVNMRMDTQEGLHQAVHWLLAYKKSVSSKPRLGGDRSRLDYQPTDFIRALQRQLRAEGAYHGPDDGIVNRDLKRAIFAYPNPSDTYNFDDLLQDFGDPYLARSIEYYRNALEKLSAAQDTMREHVLNNDGSIREQRLGARYRAILDRRRDYVIQTADGINRSRELYGVPVAAIPWVDRR